MTREQLFEKLKELHCLEIPVENLDYFPSSFWVVRGTQFAFRVNGIRPNYHIEIIHRLTSTNYNIISMEYLLEQITDPEIQDDLIFNLNILRYFKCQRS